MIVRSLLLIPEQKAIARTQTLNPKEHNASLHSSLPLDSLLVSLDSTLSLRQIQGLRLTFKNLSSVSVQARQSPPLAQSLRQVLHSSLQSTVQLGPQLLKPFVREQTAVDLKAQGASH